MHKAHRLVAGRKSVVCAFGLLVSHESRAAEPKRPNEPAPTADTGKAGLKAVCFQSPGHCQIQKGQAYDATRNR